MSVDVFCNSRRDLVLDFHIVAIIPRYLTNGMSVAKFTDSFDIFSSTIAAWQVNKNTESAFVRENLTIVESSRVPSCLMRLLLIDSFHVLISMTDEVVPIAVLHPA